MPASASLSIAAVADQVGGLELPDPVALAPGLRAALAGVVDPRKRRGVRHGLVVVLTAAVCAVAAGARSFVAIAEWVADLPDEVAAALGIERRCPSESTIRRLVGNAWTPTGSTPRSARSSSGCAPASLRPGGVGCSRWTARPCAAPAHRHRRVEVPARHLLAVIDHHTRRRARAARRGRQDQRDHRVRPAAGHPDRHST